MRRFSLEKFEWFVFIIVFLMMGNPFFALLSNTELLHDNINGMTKWYSLISGGIVLLLSLRSWKKMIQSIQQNMLLVAFILLAVGSVIWSVSPYSTFANSVTLVLFAYTGWYFSVRYSLAEQLDILSVSFGLGIVLSILAVLILQDITFYARVSWQGIYGNPNHLGMSSSIGAIIFWLQWLTKPHGWGRRKYLLLLSLAITTLLFSYSRTALLGFTASWVLLEFVRYRLQRDTLMLRGKTFFARIVIVILLTGPFMGATSVSKRVLYPSQVTANQCDVVLTPLESQLDRLLSRRLTIWKQTISATTRHPVIGYGYDAFWVQPEPIVRPCLPFGSSHNEFIEIALALGYVGVVIFALLALQALIRSVRGAARNQPILSLWPWAAMVLFMVAAMFETYLLSRYYWALFIAVVVFASRGVHKNTSTTSEPQQISTV